MLNKSCLAFLLAFLSFEATAVQMQCHGNATHWRDIAYSNGVMSKYKDEETALLGQLINLICQKSFYIPCSM